MSTEKARERIAHAKANLPDQLEAVNFDINRLEKCIAAAEKLKTQDGETVAAGFRTTLRQRQLQKLTFEIETAVTDELEAALPPEEPQA